jgi:hypothetical protein
MALLNCNSFRGRGLLRFTVPRWPTLALRLERKRWERVAEKVSGTESIDLKQKVPDTNGVVHGVLR